MRAFYEQIKAKINADLPRYKTVELYNNQDTNLKDLINEGVIFPAVFIDFDFNETIQLALGIKDMDMTVRFRFMFESYERGSRVEDLDLMTEFTGVFDLYKGIEQDPLQFTQFNEILRGLDEDHDMVNFPFIDYATIYRNQENYERATHLVHTPVEPDITGEVI